MFLSPGSRAKPRRRTINGQTGSLVILGEPGGRLTLTSGTPVLTSTVSGATTVYYALYKHNWILIYDGTNFVPTTFSELSQATTSAAKSPAAVAASSNYDIFVWNDSGTIRATRGPAWTSATARGTGAGTTELIQINGVWLNKQAITNGAGAQRGTYVGTICSNGSSQIDFIFGGAASGGTAAWFGVWNTYNRVSVATQVNDTVGSFTTATTGPFNPAGVGSGLNNRISIVVGLQEDCWTVLGNAITNPVSSGNSTVSIGYDSTSVVSSLNDASTSSAIILPSSCYYATQPSIGFHYFQFISFATGGTCAFYSGVTTNPWASGLTGYGRL